MPNWSQQCQSDVERRRDPRHHCSGQRAGEIGDDAFHRVEEELDRSEIGVVEF